MNALHAAQTISNLTWETSKWLERRLERVDVQVDTSWVKEIMERSAASHSAGQAISVTPAVRNAGSVLFTQM